MFGDNPTLLDARYAAPVVSAMRDGLGDKLVAVLFQFVGEIHLLPNLPNPA